MFSRRTAHWWLAAYLVASLVNVFVSVRVVDMTSKTLLMPLLLAYFVSSLAGLRNALVKCVWAALVFSWAGDLLLMGDGETFFVLGIAAFLGAQICYIIGFRPYAALGPLSRRPWLALPYVAYGVGLLALLLPGLGSLTVPVVVYATALVTMAVLSTGVSPAAAIGGAFFLLSDSLIALTELSDVLPDGAGVLIMPTYVVGQLLLVVGVLQNLGRVRGVRDLLLA